MTVVDACSYEPWSTSRHVAPIQDPSLCLYRLFARPEPKAKVALSQRALALRNSAISGSETKELRCSWRLGMSLSAPECDFPGY